MAQKPARLAEILKMHGVESQLELLLLNRLEQAGLPLGEAQFRFVPGRQFRWDRCWPDHMVAAECQGGTWTTTGAHSRGSGIARDCLKLSLGAALGWRVLPLTRQMIESGEGIALLAEALGLEARPCPASPSKRPAASASPAREADGARSRAARRAGSPPSGSATTP